MHERPNCFDVLPCPPLTSCFLQRVYIVASTARRSDTKHRILKIDRHYTPADATHELNVVEDAVVYSNQELADLKKMIGDGNRTTGGLTQLRDPYWGECGCCISFIKTSH